jgi:hypothetical protein
MAERTTEISFEVNVSEVSVLDGYCQAHGIKRTQKMRELLADWTLRKHNEAECIVRVAGRLDAKARHE